MAPSRNKRQVSPAPTPRLAKRVAKSGNVCPNCDTYVGTKNTIRCSACEKLVHILCTELTGADVLSQTGSLDSFRCNVCVHANTEDMEAELGAISDSVDVKQLLLTLVGEVKAVRATMKRYEESNALLEKEVRRLTAALQLTAAGHGKDRERRSRSRSASRVAFSANRQRNVRPAAVAIHTAKSSTQRRIGGNVQPKQAGSRRILNVGDAARNVHSPLAPTAITASYPPTSQSEPVDAAPASISALPVARVNIRTNLLFLSRLDSNVTAVQVHNHLAKHRISALRVRKIKPRFASHSSFILDVPEIEASKVFDESLWGKGTLIMDYRNRRKNVDVVETFPST